jgi:hypothetical protein
MDNACFFSMNRTGGSSLPKRVGKTYHIPGKLVVASGYWLEMLTDEMARVIREVKPMLAVVITPMPRYLDPCCDEHRGETTEEKKAEEQGRLLKAVLGAQEGDLPAAGQGTLQEHYCGGADGGPQCEGLGGWSEGCDG